MSSSIKELFSNNEFYSSDHFDSINNQDYFPGNNNQNQGENNTDKNKNSNSKKEILDNQNSKSKIEMWDNFAETNENDGENDNNY
jgi:hypothetical protein